MKQPDIAAKQSLDGWLPGEPIQLTLLGMTATAVSLAIRSGRLHPGDLRAVGELEPGCPMTIPLMLSPASCGFASPADDYLERPLDLNELMISNKAASFAVRIKGESMRDAGIFPGDLAVVDRSLAAWNGCVVLALLDGEFTVKRYLLTPGGVVLHPENPDFPDVVITEGREFEVWGVVKHSVRMKF